MKVCLRLILIINQCIIYSYSAPNDIIFSIDNNTENQISTYTNAIINSIVNDNSFIIGSVKITNLKTLPINISKNKPVKLKLYYSNEDIATDYCLFKFILKKSFSTKIVSYALIYTINNSNSIISSTKITNSTTSSSQNLDQPVVQCNYTINELNYTVLNIKVKEHYTKTVHYSFLTFAFNKEERIVYYIYYYNNTLNKIDIFKSKVPNVDSDVIDMWLIDQEFYISTYLCLLLQNNTLLIYSIELLEDYDYNLDLFNTISLDEINPIVQFPILKFGVIYFLSNKSAQLVYANKKGIYSLIEEKSNDNKWISECIVEINTQEGKQLLDFIINKNSVYILIRNYGIDIYSITFTKELKLFRSLIHPHIITFFYYKNPFYGYHYIGIQLTQSISSSEFYIELFLQDELNPRVNKVFTSNNKRLFIKSQSMDSLFSYFYDLQYKEMIMIRKGMLNSVPFLTYKLSLDQVNELMIPQLFSISNHQTGLNIPMIVTPDTIHLIDNITLPNHYVNCSFSQTGNYSIIVIQKGEICLTGQNSTKGSIDSPFVYQNLVEYHFDVREYNDYTIGWVIRISLGLILLNLIAVISAFAIKTNCFSKKFQKKGSKMEKKNKAMIYGDALVTIEDIVRSKYNTATKKKNKPRMSSESKENLTSVKMCQSGSNEISSNQSGKPEDIKTINQQTENHLKSSKSNDDDIFESPAREKLARRYIHFHYPSDMKLKQKDNEINIEEENFDVYNDNESNK